MSKRKIPDYWPPENVDWDAPIRCQHCEEIKQQRWMFMPLYVCMDCMEKHPELKPAIRTGTPAYGSFLRQTRHQYVLKKAAAS